MEMKGRAAGVSFLGMTTPGEQEGRLAVTLCPHALCLAEAAASVDRLDVCLSFYTIITSCLHGVQVNHGADLFHHLLLHLPQAEERESIRTQGKDLIENRSPNMMLGQTLLGEKEGTAGGVREDGVNERGRKAANKEAQWSAE